MLCASCLTWPTVPPDLFCGRCAVVIRGVQGFRQSRVIMRALRSVHPGEVVYLDSCVSDRRFPDIETMIDDIEGITKNNTPHG